MSAHISEYERSTTTTTPMLPIPDAGIHGRRLEYLKSFYASYAVIRKGMRRKLDSTFSYVEGMLLSGLNDKPGRTQHSELKFGGLASHSSTGVNPGYRYDEKPRNARTQPLRRTTMPEFAITDAISEEPSDFNVKAKRVNFLWEPRLSTPIREFGIAGETKFSFIGRKSPARRLSSTTNPPYSPSPVLR